MHGSRARLVAITLGALLAVHVVRAGAQRNERPAADVGTPTFNNDIAPIIGRHCVNCHRPGRPVPMTLRSYAEVRPWLARIRVAIETGRMPPWSADPRFGHFSNDASLNAADRQRLLAWIDAGAPAGAGPPVVIAAPDHAWTHPSGRPPDLVVELPGRIGIPASGQWPTFNLYSALPDSLRQGDHFVEAVQLLPGNSRVTHHSSLSTRVLPPGVSLGRAHAWPGGPLLDGLPVVANPAALTAATPRAPTGAAAFSSAGTAHLTYYFPGNDGFVLFPSGAGKRLPASAHLEWSLHYAPSGTPQEDRHTAGLWLHRSPPSHEVITLRVGDFHIVNGREVVLPAGLVTNPGHAAIVDVPDTCAGRPCSRPQAMLPRIPPGATNWRITGITPVLDDLTVYSLSPHGHLRLQDMTYVVTYPDGREETALRVPRYDFDWQFVYRLAEPMRVPAGSTLKVIAHYDNSGANRVNPDATRPVDWSEQSTDEMFNGFIDLSIDRHHLDGREDDRTEPPPSPLVIVTGCASRERDGRWVLDRATSPARSTVVHADALEVASARRTPDENRYRLHGTADFAPVVDLLAAGDRAAFTTTATANTTRVLEPGRSVGVKGVLVGGAEPAINLVSAWPVAGACDAR
ncbi:MAG: hypothetical protein AB7H96_23780 [Vicinamibacterales bacterium]